MAKLKSRRRRNLNGRKGRKRLKSVPGQLQNPNRLKIYFKLGATQHKILLFNFLLKFILFHNKK